MGERFESLREGAQHVELGDAAVKAMSMQTKALAAGRHALWGRLVFGRRLNMAVQDPVQGMDA
jgi:hypothetical protein